MISLDIVIIIRVDSLITMNHTRFSVLLEIEIPHYNGNGKCNRNGIVTIQNLVFDVTYPNSTMIGKQTLKNATCLK